MSLEKDLYLNKYFLDLFGQDSFDQFRLLLKNTPEGIDNSGYSYIMQEIIKQGRDKLDHAYLLMIDEKINSLVEKLANHYRGHDLRLKYFQYIAILFTEIFLERYFKDRENFLDELNAFQEISKEKRPSKVSSFSKHDMQKIAFWMATGSGKTLIMHLNYWQVLSYAPDDWDNIILITPNEGLSRQHQEEYVLSGIPNRLYTGNLNDLKTRKNEVLIIDIHKLTENKKGSGVSIDVSWFEGKNLVFIDEGHKGQKSEEQKWKKLRESLGRKGLVFEYSATFGQVIGKNKELLDEYAKSIIFDYSYKYFYTDGYGKNFHVYDIRDKNYSNEQKDLVLIANLLAFYEQLLIFQERRDFFRKYNIEKPLWIFVGSKVAGKALNSDIIQVIKFFDKIFKNKQDLESKVNMILDERSGMLSDDGCDIFKDSFIWLKKLRRRKEFNIDDIFKIVFNGKGPLELHEIKNADGEIGLKASIDSDYFGVINVGDLRPLKKLVSMLGIQIKEDHFSDSLFFNLNEASSPVNLLIGSKKFIEGWNSWRVSSMGLINIGKGEGPQIIQLFGRGVRLKGESNSLKRVQNAVYMLRALQTLNIFGLNAEYMNAFLTAIRKEGIKDELIFKKDVKVDIGQEENDKFVNQDKSHDIENNEKPILLVIDKKILKEIHVDLRPRVIHAHGLQISKITMKDDELVVISDEILEVVDFNDIFLRMMRYKVMKRMFNLVIDVKIIEEILRSRLYKLSLPRFDGLKITRDNDRFKVELSLFRGIFKIHDILEIVCKEYISRFYRAHSK
ncbi:MAG: DEAD/DEAH box helicase family protein [Promethearchaeota archaeon]